MSNIIYNYHKGNPSKEIRKSFQWWLLNSDDSDKDQQILDIWNSTVGEAGKEEEEDFNNLVKRISDSGRRKASVAHKLAIAASLVIVASLSCLGTYSILHREYRENIADQEFLQVTVPNGESREMCLYDGTKVILGAGSNLIYPQKFSFGSRKVFLSGKAYFDVAKDPEHPFVVNTRDISVTALGTKFDVDAYAESKTVSTTLLDGRIKVNVSSIYDLEETEFVLEPNQQLVLDIENKNVALKDVDAGKKLSWTKGYQIFESSRLSEIFSALETYYGVRIVCEDIDDLQGSYNVKFFPGESIEEVLEILRNINNNFFYMKVDGIYYIKTY
jgi:transmembrane sensor